WKGRLSYTETPLEFCSGSLHTKGSLSTYVHHLVYIGVIAQPWILGPVSGNRVPLREGQASTRPPPPAPAGPLPVCTGPDFEIQNQIHLICYVFVFFLITSKKYGQKTNTYSSCEEKDYNDSGY